MAAPNSNKRFVKGVTSIHSNSRSQSKPTKTKSSNFNRINRNILISDDIIQISSDSDSEERPKGLDNNGLVTPTVGASFMFVGATKQLQSPTANHRCSSRSNAIGPSSGPGSSSGDTSVKIRGNAIPQILATNRRSREEDEQISLLEKMRRTKKLKPGSGSSQTQTPESSDHQDNSDGSLQILSSTVPQRGVLRKETKANQLMSAQLVISGELATKLSAMPPDKTFQATSTTVQPGTSKCLNLNRTLDLTKPKPQEEKSPGNTELEEQLKKKENEKAASLHYKTLEIMRDIKEKQIDTLTREKTESEHEVKKLSDVVLKLEKENRQIKSQKTELEISQDYFKSKIEKDSAEKIRLELQVRELQNSKRETEVVRQGLKSEIEGLKTRLENQVQESDAKKKELEASVENMSRELEKNRHEKIQLQQKILESEGQKNDLQTTLDSKKYDFVSFKNDLKQISKEKSRFEEQISRLEKEKCRYEQHISKLENENCKLESELEEVRSEFASNLQTEAEKQKIELAAISSENVELKVELEKVSMEKVELESQLQKLEKEKKENEEITKAKELLQDERVQLLEIKILEMSAVKKSVEDSLVELERSGKVELQDVQTKKDKLENDLKALTLANSQQKSRIEELQNEIQASEQTVEEAKTESNKRNAYIDLISKKKFHLEDCIKKQEELLIDKENLIKKLNTKMDFLESRDKETIVHLTRKLKKQKEESEEAGKQFKKLRYKYEDLAKDFDKEKKESARDLYKQKKENESVARDLLKLQTEKKQHENAIKDLTTKNLKMHDDKCRLKIQIDEMKGSGTDDKTRFQKLTKKNSRLKKENEAMKMKIASLECLKGHHEKMLKQKQQVAEARNPTELTAKSFQDLKCHNVKLAEELKLQKDLNKSLENQINSLQGKTSSIDQGLKRGIAVRKDLMPTSASKQ